jgi:hypothetical protein
MTYSRDAKVEGIVALMAIGSIEQGDANRLQRFLDALPPDVHSRMLRDGRNSMFQLAGRFNQRSSGDRRHP